MGLKGLPIKPDVLKSSGAKAVMDDSIEEKRKLEKLTDMPAVDMSMPDGGASVGENLEVDDDDDEANKLDEANRARAKDAMDVDDEEEEDEE